MSESEGWTQWSKHVLLELERLNNDIEKEQDKREDRNEVVDNKINDMSTELTKLKVKMTIIAVVISSIPVLFDFITKLL